MDMRLQLVPLPTSDVDRSKEFYVERVGFGLDHDVEPGNGMRVVQLTPPGSACSIVVGVGIGRPRRPSRAQPAPGGRRRRAGPGAAGGPGRGRLGGQRHGRRQVRVLQRPGRELLGAAGAPALTVDRLSAATRRASWSTPSTSPERSRIGREYSVESLWISVLPSAQRRPRPGRGQRPVDPAAAPRLAGGAAPDPGEVGARDRLQPAGADDPPVGLGHPQLHPVAAGPAGAAARRPARRRPGRRTPRPAIALIARTSASSVTRRSVTPSGRLDVDGERRAPRRA